MGANQPPLPSADSIFADWLARHDEGEEVEFEELVRDHPGEAELLREFHHHWMEIEAVRRRARSGRADPLSVVIGRLAARGATGDRYQRETEIGRGGMGEVVRVWDEDLQRPLAMKLMLGQGAVGAEEGSSPREVKQLARFLEEAQVTGQLDHPGVVPVHEIGLDPDGRIYFTMKLVRGRTLQQVFEELARDEGGWTQTRVLGLLLRVCEAMSYAHARRVVHRDLKPANVMVGRFGEVYVMDWGLARVLEDPRPGSASAATAPASAVRTVRRADESDTPSSPLRTEAGDIVGTPAYMSPEQARGRVDDVGPPSDVYSLGAMLYHLLSGRMPTSALDTPNTAGAGDATPVVPLHECAPGTPGELEAICEKAMAWDPARRYPDMSALAGDLSAYLEGRVVRAYETGAWAEARKWVRRNKPLAAALAAGVLALMAGLVSSLVLKAQSDDNAQLARDNAEDADAQRKIAEENAALAKAETTKVLRLSDVQRLQDLELEADRLWPPHPGRIDDLESWLLRAEALVANLDLHRETLEEMRATAAPWSDEDRVRDRDTHPRSEELAKYVVELDEMIDIMEEGRQSEADEDDMLERIAEIEPLIAELQQTIVERRTWRLPTPEEQWQHDVLSHLVQGLVDLEADLLPTEADAAGRGWSMRRRLEFARRLRQGFGPEGEYTKLWEDALPALRASYPGLEIAPQIGLAPLGPDSASGLWEFAHLMTGDSAVRGSDGQLVLTEESGLVLVLLPGGAFWMGAQSTDPTGRNYDPEARASEAPVHEVELSPFFLSKFEMTQGQWLRLTGDNPSHYGMHNWNNLFLAPPTFATLLHPIEHISWNECTTWLPRAGLDLPTDAQCEYGFRGGTGTAWWTGSDRESLSGAANLVDAHAKANGAETFPGHELWLNDGATVHAPIGTYRANPFGLHEVIGNVWEWCKDGFDVTFYSRSPRQDPLLPPAGRPTRVNRGGNFGVSAAFSRSACRNGSPPQVSDAGLGVRPARPLVR